MTITTTSAKKDWRVNLLGHSIQANKDGPQEEDPEAFPPLVATTQAFEGYYYIALFFCADYCPFCKKFAPHVVAAADEFEKKKCKPLVISNDRDQDAFVNSCKKVAGIDVAVYDTARTRNLRDLFGLKTIPALIILENDNFAKSTPTVVTNGRRNLEYDPKLLHFPWASPKTEHGKDEAPMTKWERFWIQGRHGKWWHFGHTNVPGTAHPDKSYMDEQAVRIRAGILNVITWLALMNVLFWTEELLVKFLFPLVSFEFAASTLFGLTPIAPIGTIATGLSLVFHPEPTWKPAPPKRFAWLIGLTLAVSCFVVFSFRDDIKHGPYPDAYKPAIASIVLTCNIATWLEGNCGFCVGCVIYNHWVIKCFKGMEDCSECS